MRETKADYFRAEHLSVAFCFYLSSPSAGDSLGGMCYILESSQDERIVDLSKSVQKTEIETSVV